MVECQYNSRCRSRQDDPGRSLSPCHDCRYTDFPNVARSDFADEAVERFRRSLAEGRPYQAIIFDLTKASGFGDLETFDRLKAIQPDIKPIACSGRFNDPIMTSPEEHGFSAAIAKPFIPRTLIDTVMTALESTDLSPAE